MTVSKALQKVCCSVEKRGANQTKDEKHIVVPALRRTSSGVSMEYKCIIIAKCSEENV
jgi:hypothetical protein